MISLGSLELVVFMDQVNLRDLGFTSVDSLTTLALETLLFPPGVRERSMPMVWAWLPALPTLRLPSIPLKHGNLVSLSSGQGASLCCRKKGIWKIIKFPSNF